MDNSTRQTIVIHHGKDPEIIRWLMTVVVDIPGMTRLENADSIRLEICSPHPPSFEGYSDRGWYRSREGGGYDVIDATTEEGMRQARQLLTGETMSAPRPAVSTPAIKDCTIVFHNNRNAIDQVYEMVSSIDGRIGNSLPHKANAAYCISVSSSLELIGFNRDSGEWYRSNNPYREWPQFDATTQMEQIKAHFGLAPGTPTAQPAEPVAKADPKLRAPGKPTRGDALIVVTSPSLSEQVQRILFKAGHEWAAGGKEPQNLTQIVLIAGRYLSHDGSGIIRYSSSLQDNKSRKPDWPVFDAATEMDQIYRFFGVKKEAMTLEQIIRPALLNLIRSIPTDDAVAGFIRRDLQLVLPPEVQAAGTDAICKWIVEQKVGPEAAAALPAQPAPVNEPDSPVMEDHVFDFSYRQRVSGSQSFTRTDIVHASITVPAEVMQEARDARNFEIVRDWISENIGESTEDDRNYGDEDTSDENVDYREDQGLTDVNELQRDFNEAIGQ